MRCFYLKIGSGNSLAVDWLAGKNPLGRPAAVIFFGRTTVEDIRNGNCNRQAKDFYESSLPQERDQTLIIVVGHGKAWFLKPAGEIVEYVPLTDADAVQDIWKIMPVDIISTQRLSQIPPVLAGINANAYLSRGTYRKIKPWGNIKAIYCSLKMPLPMNHLQAKNCKAVHLLECLSSVELETLVAKVFEAAGCFVPAYRGGYIQDIDLFVHNDQSTKIRLGDLVIPAKGSLSIQVKGWTRLKTCPATVDCLIGFRIPQSLNCFDDEWLLEQVKRFPDISAWLRRSLSWLPQEFIEKCGL